MQVPDLTHNETGFYSAVLDIVRGGLPSSETTGKLFAVAYLVQGLLLTLCTKQQSRLYGWSDTKLSYLLLQETAAVILATGVAACAVQFYNPSTRTAFGHFGLCYLVMYTKWYLSDMFVKAGSSNDKLIVPCLTTLLVTYDGFFESSWAGPATLIVSVLYIIMALGGILSPEQFGKLWGLDVTVDKKAPYEVTHFNVFFIVYHLQKILLFYDIAPHNALGLASLVALLFFVDGYYGTKGIVEILNKPNKAYLFWLVFFSLSCSDILLQGQRDIAVGSKEEL